jgi:hypothetical protein
MTEAIAGRRRGADTEKAANILFQFRKILMLQKQQEMNN